MYSTYIFLNTCRKYSHLFSQDFCWWLTICFYHFLFFPYLWVVLNLLMVVIALQLQDFYWKPQPRLFHCEKYSPSQVQIKNFQDISSLIVNFEIFSGLKKSIWYIINGAVMTVVFFFCRVVFFPLVYYLYSIENGKFTKAKKYPETISSLTQTLTNSDLFPQGLP